MLSTFIGVSLAGEECFLDVSIPKANNCFLLPFPRSLSTSSSPPRPFVRESAVACDDGAMADRLLGRPLLKFSRFSVNVSWSFPKCSNDFCPDIFPSVSRSCSLSVCDRSENDLDLLLPIRVCEFSTKAGSNFLCLSASGEFGGVRNGERIDSLSSLDTLMAGSLVFIRRTNLACSAFRLLHLVLYSLARVSYVNFKVSDLPRFVARALLEVSVKSD